MSTWVILDRNGTIVHSGTKEQSDQEMRRLTYTIGDDPEPYENATKSWHSGGPFRQESRA